jgi:tripartite-type tricarboxylate transporter receptor subunit TctC
VFDDGLDTLCYASAMKRRLLTLLLALTTLAISPASAPAQLLEEFYRGKTLQLYVGFGPGASYDLYARLVAEHLGRHLPGNPRVVTVNMEGAGSLRLVNWLYNAAPKDGTAFGTASRAAPFASLIGTQGGTQFDASKFTWIGSANNEVSTCVTSAASGLRTFDDLREQQLVMGGDGPAADGEQFARVMNELFGTKIKIVSGYPGGNAINLALERGEVHGRCGWSWTGIKAERRHWVEQGKINVVVQIGMGKHPDLPNVPSLLDLARTDEQKQILRLILARQPLGRPFFAPPGIPGERAEALRSAFMATMRDPAFVAAAEKAKLEVNPLSGAEVAALVSEVFASMTPQLQARTRQMLSPN